MQMHKLICIYHRNYRKISTKKGIIIHHKDISNIFKNYTANSIFLFLWEIKDEMSSVFFPFLI